MFNYDSVKLELKVGDNSVHRFSSRELHLLDLSLLGSLYSCSESLLWLFDHSPDESDFFHLASELDTFYNLYDLLFSESRGDDITKDVSDSVSRAKILVFKVKKNHNLIKHSADNSRFNDLIQKEFSSEAN